MTDAPSTDLVVVETLVPAIVFAPGGVRTILDKLKSDVRSIKRDISTPKGRAAVKSLAFKVARSKTALDTLGKDLVADLKAQTGAIDAERRVIRDELDDLKAEVLSEHDAWEAAEEKRIAAHEAVLEEIYETGGPAEPPLSSDEVRFRLHRLDEISMSGRDWQEFIHRAVDTGKAARLSLEQQLADAEAREAAEAEAIKLAAEQEVLRVAELARLQAEREAEIARVAAEEAKRVAEEAAKQEAEKARLAAEAEAARIAEIARLEKERIETAAREAAQAAEREKERLRLEAAKAKAEAEEQAAAQERERLRLIEEAEANERRRKLEIEMAETARLAAERQKEREVQQAIDAERQRIANERQKEADAQAAREKDVANKKRVNGEIKADLMALGLTEALAISVITGVVKKSVRHLSVTY
jgi:colicin import membrane protein